MLYESNNYKKLVTAIYPNSSNTGNANIVGGNSTTQTSNMNTDKKEVLDLINKQRTNNGLQVLKIDNE